MRETFADFPELACCQLCKLFMLTTGDQCYFKQEQVCIEADTLNVFIRHVSCGIHRRMDAVFLALYQDFFPKDGLQQAFGAGAGHTVARGVIKVLSIWLWRELSERCIHFRRPCGQLCGNLM